MAGELVLGLGGKILPDVRGGLKFGVFTLVLMSETQLDCRRLSRYP